MCQYLPMFVNNYQYVSIFVNMCRYLLTCFNICQYVSISVPITFQIATQSYNSPYAAPSKPSSRLNEYEMSSADVGSSSRSNEYEMGNAVDRHSWLLVGVHVNFHHQLLASARRIGLVTDH